MKNPTIIPGKGFGLCWSHKEQDHVKLVPEVMSIPHQTLRLWCTGECFWGPWPTIFILTLEIPGEWLYYPPFSHLSRLESGFRHVNPDPTKKTFMPMDSILNWKLGFWTSFVEIAKRKDKRKTHRRLWAKNQYLEWLEDIRKKMLKSSSKVSNPGIDNLEGENYLPVGSIPEAWRPDISNVMYTCWWWIL